MNVKKYLAFFAISLLLFGGRVIARAAVTSLTVTVNRVGDGSDLNPGDGLCDTSANAGEQCSLRAALEELNAQGPDTTPHRIEFDIPGAGPFTINPGSALPSITVPVEIDGATQPGAACPTVNVPANLLVVLDGSSAGTGANGIHLGLGSDGSTVGGLVIGNFDENGILISSSDNHVICNHIGLQADGVSPMGNGTGVNVSGTLNKVGGHNAHATRNVISANQGNGIRFIGNQHEIANNFIGTTADGMGDLGNGYDGIRVDGDASTVGGPGNIARNVISGNATMGIEVFGKQDNLILGNYIGVARDGLTPLPNDNHGIYLFSDSLNFTIGGTSPGEGNIIAYNGFSGVGLKEYSFLGTFPTQIEIRGNAIFENGVMNDPYNGSYGIDLGLDGPDANDPGDGDSGENERQNYPVLTATPGNFILQGAIDGYPFTSYDIDVYRSESCDPSGYGEGQQYLVSVVVSTGGSGEEGFLVDLTGLVADGNVVTATATDPLGNTSEFSACVTMSAAVPPTATPTASPTRTPTPTGTPPTPTQTPTSTWTPTPGPSPTWTYTPTPGPSPTPTSTAISGPSPTSTWTATPGPSPTPTLTFTPGPSPTPTATGSPEPEPTATSPPGDPPGLSAPHPEVRGRHPELLACPFFW